MKPQTKIYRDDTDEIHVMIETRKAYEHVWYHWLEHVNNGVAHGFYGEYYYLHFSFILLTWLTATNAIAQSLSQVKASYALIKFKTNEVCFHIIMPHQSVKH